MSHDGSVNGVSTLFGKTKVIIGVIHCRPLPGSARYAGEAMQEICDIALRDAEAYRRGGVDGLIVENHGDIPFLKPDHLGPETVAAMAVIADRVKRTAGVPVGINFLANAALPALSVAKAADCDFIRMSLWANAYVANEGILEGPAGCALRFRSWIHARGVKVFADVHVKHGAHAMVSDRAVADLARDAEFFDADAVIVTGQHTGAAASHEEVKEMASGTELPIIVGSGANTFNIESLLSVAAGAIVGSSLKEDGVWSSPVSERKTRELMEVVNSLR